MSQDSKNIYEEIFENAVDGVIIGSPDGNIRNINVSMLKMLNAKKEDLIGKHISEIFPTHILEKKPLRFDLLAKGETIFNEREIIRKDGVSVFIEMHSKQMPDGSFHSIIRNITERKKAEKIISENEAFIRSVMDNLPLGISVNSVNPEVNFSYMNENFPKYYRTTKDELSKRDNFWEAVYDDPYFRRIIKKRVTDDCASGDVEKMQWHEVPITRKGKKTKYISARNIPIPDKDIMISLVWDVTKTKENEESLRYFQKAVEASSDAIGMSTPDGKHYYQNKAFDELFGLKVDEVASPHVKSTIYADEKIGDEVFSTIMSGGEWIGEIKMIGKGKKIIDVYLRAYSLKDEKGKVVGLVGVHTDITQRKKTETVLDNQNRLLTTLLENLPVGVFMVDAKNGKPFYANETAKKILGKDLIRSVTRKNIAKTYSAYKRSTNKLYPADEMPIFRAMGGQRSHVDDMYILQPDGKKVLLEIFGSPVYDNKNNIVASLITFIDITEKHKLMESAQRAEKLESLAILAGGIAHDFNNLLSGIYGFLNLARNAKSEEEQTEYLNTTLSTINRAKGLTQQILTFAKGGEPERHNEELKDFIHDTINFALSGSNISCNYDVSDNLWTCSIDKPQISQVLENIVINAQHAMPGGGEIDITARNIFVNEGDYPDLQSGNYVKISIKDRGHGIPADTLNKIFDPFFSTKDEGSGLGLPMSYSIIKRHNGIIDVESEVNVGSTFHIFIPALTESTFNKEQNIEIPHKGSGTILLMDDQQIIRDTMGGMLRSFGYDVVFKVSGDDVVEYLKTNIKKDKDITAIILDLTIPGKMGARETISEIRKISENIPVFVTSGYIDDPVMISPQKYGFTASISKPIVMSEFSDMLNIFLTN